MPLPPRNPCLITPTVIFPLMPYGFPLPFALELLAGITMIEPQGVLLESSRKAVLADQRLCYASLLVLCLCDAWNCHDETIRDYTASPMRVEGISLGHGTSIWKHLTYCLGLEGLISWSWVWIHQMEILFLLPLLLYSRHAKNIIWSHLFDSNPL